MNIHLSVIGKLKDTALKTLFDEYHKRLDWKLTLSEFEGKDDLLLKSIPAGSYVILMDEKGENISSQEFADLLHNIQLHHQGKASFIIGGADGLSPVIKAKGKKTLSLGQMTWPHLLARVMLMEQLYRAQQILKGHPYHRA
jgi:23S rRNA (pseudouridine1915-N3)-methyltransferase